jgi:hypothetical protein
MVPKKPAIPVVLGILLASLMALPAVARAEDRAHVVLNSSNVVLTQTSNTQWTLTKTGSTGASAITWLVKATPTSSTWGLLFYNGTFTVDNRGTAAATIGTSSSTCRPRAVTDGSRARQ